VPPDRTSLAEGPLHHVHDLVCGGHRFEVGCSLGVADRSPGFHQATDEIGPLRLFEPRVGHPPQPAADHEVPPVRGHRMLHTRYADLRCDLAAGFFATASLAGFLPVIGISISF
jgi:hypothetical protein